MHRLKFLPRLGVRPEKPDEVRRNANYDKTSWSLGLLFYPGVNSCIWSRKLAVLTDRVPFASFVTDSSHVLLLRWSRLQVWRLAYF